MRTTQVKIYSLGSRSAVGKSGLMTTASGLRIACLGGIYDAEIYTSTDTPPVREATITHL